MCHNPVGSHSFVSVKENQWMQKWITLADRNWIFWSIFYVLKWPFQLWHGNLLRVVISIQIWNKWSFAQLVIFSYSPATGLELLLPQWSCWTCMLRSLLPIPVALPSLFKTKQTNKKKKQCVGFQINAHEILQMSRESAEAKHLHCTWDRSGAGPLDVDQWAEGQRVWGCWHHISSRKKSMPTVLFWKISRGGFLILPNGEQPSFPEFQFFFSCFKPEPGPVTSFWLSLIGGLWYFNPLHTRQSSRTRAPNGTF